MTTIGIDLGTTNSACGYWLDGKVNLIPNRIGEFLTPSVVGIDDGGKITVGKIAKERLITHTSKTTCTFKRIMGTNHLIQLGKQKYSAVELSAIMLRSLKEDAEVFLKTSVTKAVISVPAYFNDNQRHATKQAGELAGLKVDRLINEPTAAALAYGLHHKSQGTFLILDMGGGTFDVSILEFFNGVMEVHASSGDNFLGGEDFVEAMISDILKEYDIKKETLSTNELQRLYMLTETAKRKIGSATENILSMKLKNMQLNKVITDEWINDIFTPLLFRVKNPIERALSDARIATHDIDEIILVGGATRLGIFRSTVGRIFGRIPSCNIDPDLAITMGATIQAGLIQNEAGLDDFVLTDVCPYTLGTEVAEPNLQSGYFLPIIDRNTTVPTSRVVSVNTIVDNQPAIRVNIYQGENRRVEKNIYLGSLDIIIPKKPAGQKIDIRYSYDMNGLLEVDVLICETGKVYSKIIEQIPGTLSNEEKNKALERLAQLKFHPRDQEENRAIIAKGERLFETSLDDRRTYIANIISDFERVLNKQNQMEIMGARIKLKEILDRMDDQL